ncbi:MAG TPA: hypothetical protein VI197_07245 [Polyangiaceae bacterium]
MAHQPTNLLEARSVPLAQFFSLALSSRSEQSLGALDMLLGSALGVLRGRERLLRLERARPIEGILCGGCGALSSLRGFLSCLELGFEIDAGSVGFLQPLR